MIDPEEIGKGIRAAWEECPQGASINTGGNLGMIYLAYALAEVAEALNRIADAK